MVAVVGHVAGGVVLINVIHRVIKLILGVHCGMELAASAAVEILVGAIAPSVISPGEIERGATAGGVAAGLI